MLHGTTVSDTSKNITAVATESIPPDAARLIMALRQIGYSFEQAISDLVDNSINARSKNVLIRFVWEDDGIRSIIIADDGDGMGRDDLHDAMRFGSEKEAESGSLGKYGMGLKLASLSHARCLSVLTRKGNHNGGRRWTIEGIEKDWQCEVLQDNEVAGELDAPWSRLDLSKSGTLVVWDDIDKLPSSSRGLRPTLISLQKRLQVHLGLCFHRFLEDGRLKIKIDQQEYGGEENAISATVPPLNPFKYSTSGNPEYPKIFTANVEGAGELLAEAHIWPPNSDQAEYKLGNRAAARQGFYFYRNDRLIQAGGWNGIVQHESEPHSSLARVRVDLPPEYDASFGLNVQKSAVITPPAFESSMSAATSDDGDVFEDYRRAAQNVYRKKDKGAHKDFPLVPSNGLPKRYESEVKRILAPGPGRIRRVDFEWVEFESGDLFDVDRDEHVIYLNQAYRKHLLGGLPKGKTDLPLLKTLIFLLVEEDFDKGRMSAKRKKRLKDINDVITKAAIMGRG